MICCLFSGGIIISFSSFVSSSIEFEQFDNVKARAEKFRSKCLSFERRSKDSFYNVILYAVVFKMNGKKEFVTDENKVEEIIGKDTFDLLKKLKDSLRFDVNDVLMKKIFF